MNSDTIAPCGPECRHARPLPEYAGDWVWCTRRGEPRAANANATECRAFSPRELVGGPLLEHTSLGGGSKGVRE